MPRVSVHLRSTVAFCIVWLASLFHGVPHARAFDSLKRGHIRRAPFTSRILFGSKLSSTTLFENSDDGELGGEDRGPLEKSSSDFTTDQTSSAIFQRFLSPKIDDPGLPITDTLLAQVVAPSLQIFWISLVHAPSPSWLRPLGSYFGEAPELAPRGSLLAPTLIHGAGLAVCWLAAALAARMYEQESFSLKDVDSSDSLQKSSLLLSTWSGIRRYDTVLTRLVQAGAFATGLLILSTQIDLFLEFRRYVQIGESEETDLRLLVAIVELINDIAFEAMVLGSWRMIHASFMSNTTNRSKRF